MSYTIITENDTSKWEDQTGFQYHFPDRYLKFLQPGTKVIYYKGRLKNSAFKNHRLSSQPHYFAMATIRTVNPDKKSSKKDYYAAIANFTSFDQPVHLKKKDGALFEKIPVNRERNYWRDGVRQISASVYKAILSAANLEILDDFTFLDKSNDNQDWETIEWEGGKKVVYGTRYERDEELREKAIKIHGLNCMACELNFEAFYGQWGKGFIHVHHTKPISTLGGKQPINARKDLVVLCPNCHAMVHRKKGELLTVSQLKKLIRGRTSL